MKKLLKAISSENSSDGFVIPFCGLLLVVFFGMASFVIDIGNARYQLRTIQIAADACSLAALVPLSNVATRNYTGVRNEVWDMAARNNVTQAEVTKIDCGAWAAGVFTSQGLDGGGIPICNAATNAVQVSISRQVRTFFGKVLNTTFITPATLAVSSMTPNLQCIKPFGINQALVNALPLGVTQITVDRASPGNWGKLDFGTPFSMMNDTCDADIRINGSVETETGFSRLKTSFNAIEGTSNANGLIIALTSPFPNGGSAPVTILEFVRVNFLTSSGNGNSTWTATFEIVERNVSPNPDPNSSSRKLVK